MLSSPVPVLLHDSLTRGAAQWPDNTAVTLHGKDQQLSYKELKTEADRVSAGLLALGLETQARVAIYLPKTLETASAFYAISQAGGVFVPVNPLLKPEQVQHLLKDCDCQILITARNRHEQLAPSLRDCKALRTVIEIDPPKKENGTTGHYRTVCWTDLPQQDIQPNQIIDKDIAAILYTSGSTGRPKGVILSHRNILSGAVSVADYLEITSADTLLAVLPFSFDYGLNQLTSAILQGAHCVLMDYLLPKDVLRALEQHSVTGLAAVPPLWNQLANLQWPASVIERLRYITNSGGAMPEQTLAKLRANLPQTKPYLMYGLTEAFRSTYLPPEEIDARPGSIGKAIPNAEILVVNSEGELCGPDEPGELVHRGALVALGYWNDPERTAIRYRPVPGADPGLPIPELAVWSGDIVRADADGYLYFIGRNDGMIKTSGYRVSPEEVEEPVYTSGLVATAAAIGVPHPQIGQAICLVAVALGDALEVHAELAKYCRAHLPNYMCPAHIELVEQMPQTPNGKIDRNLLAERFESLFQENGEAS